MMPPRVTDSPYAEEQLLKMVDEDADNWKARKTYARFLYDRGEPEKAAQLVWDAPEIPSVDFEIAFAARILAKGTPRRAIRLLNAVLENNKGRPVQNLGLANALLHHGMVMQAARFYGAAIEADDKGDVLNPDLEHFLLWIDDKEKLWGDFEGQRDELDELPWMNRNAEQADDLRRAMSGHTTPVRVMSGPPIDMTKLPPIPAEQPRHSMYVQSSDVGGEPTPPPAVTIPMDRVAEKDRVFDEKHGADSAPSAMDGIRDYFQDETSSQPSPSSPFQKGNSTQPPAKPTPSTPKPIFRDR